MKNHFSSKILLLFFCIQCFTQHLAAQCPSSGFTIASPICVGSPLQITNTSVGAVSYNWDFSSNFLSQTATIASDTLLNIPLPGDITQMWQGDTMVVFVSGFADSKIHRVTYGNGPENPVTNYEDLGNMGALYQPSDVAFFKENGTYYGLVVDFGSNFLYRFRLGNSLFGTPDSISAVLTAATSNFNYPRSIKLVQDSTGNIYGMVANHGNGNLVILDFGNSIHNTPTSTSYATGTSSIKDAIFAQTCGNWHAFLGCSNAVGIRRADFGSSLSNTPTFTQITSSAAYITDIVLIHDGPEWKLACTDDASWIVRKYNLGTDLTNNSATTIGQEFFSGYQTPKGICYARKGSDAFLFTMNESKRLMAIKYTNNVDVNIKTSTDFEPAGITFNTAGSYPVTLYIENAAGYYSTYTDTIDISTAPASAFSTVNTCLGDVTSFTDSSSYSNGTITSWNWDFGDSNSDTNQNPSHQYASPGYYQVSLTTAGASGCSNTYTDTVLITTHPNAAFLYPNAVCSMTDMQFTDQSNDTMSTITQWLWDFGNGDTLMSQNPVYAYPMGGSFGVTLTVTTAEGCSASASNSLQINDRPSAAFTATNTCVGQAVTFTDNTILSNSQIQSYDWQFGDSFSDTVANPVHSYAGGVFSYNVQMIVTAVNGCIDTALQTIKINNVPAVNFSFAPSAICSNTNVSFTDLSNVNGDTISAWYWDFGNNEFDTVQNPVHTFSTAGQHIVTLIAYSPSSCPGVAFQQTVDVKQSPDASFTSSPTCVGDATNFTNNSTAPTGSSIDSVIWTFNSQDSSIIFNPAYLFASSGTYPVSLWVRSTDGCVDTMTSFVDVHANPVASFNHSLACDGNAVLFTNTSSCDTASTITQYVWNFGDVLSGSNNYSNMQNPSHTYDTTIAYTASLISTTNFGCSDTALGTFTVAASPTVQFTYSPTCFGDLMEFFNPGSSNDSTYLWNFGDNQTNQLREPAHYYAAPGSYTVRLNVMAKSGCQGSAVKQVAVSPIPVADFSTNPACINSSYQINDQSQISSGFIASWQWLIDAQSVAGNVQDPVTTFADTGQHNVTLTVISDIGCSDAVTKIIDAHPLPVSSFSFDPQYGTPPLQIQTLDLSTGGQTYSWTFGDGTPSESLQEPAHTYVDTGWYTISQIVTSQFGCMHSSNKNIYVINPVLDVAITGDSSYFDGQYFHVVARLENRGTREITSLQLQATLENESTISEAYTDSMPTGALGMKTCYFHASFVVNDVNSVRYYCIKALNPNGQADSHPEDNELCFNLTDQFLFVNPYPNPFQNELRLKFMLPKSENMQIQLYDNTGKMVQTVFDGKAPKNLFEISADVTLLQKGVYTVKVSYRDKVIAKHVVKQ
jgi:PKD repeat protein